MKSEIVCQNSAVKQSMLQNILNKHAKRKESYFTVFEIMFINQERSLLFAKAFGEVDARKSAISKKLWRKILMFN